MHIIPVMDLLDGVVVHAIKGERTHYQPIVSRLSSSSKPIDIVKGFMDVYPFKTLYIADLNAIQQHQQDRFNHQVILEILEQFPNLQLWLDAGLNIFDASFDNIRKLVQPILGTENFKNLSAYLNATEKFKRPHSLSIDFMANGYQGPLELLETSSNWPNDIVVMSLTHVGSNAGANTSIFKSLPIKSHHRIYAAGGVRNIDDLCVLKSHHIHGALIATALHLKQLGRKELETLQA
ncbi:MAG: HisA/HisF-related TIM barrel protein [Methylophilus sp.]|nr:HisA/HisF-related TIM barrel protein [Methylophilus sp.]